MEDKSGRESKKRLWDTGRYLVGCLLLLCMAGKSYAQGDDFGVWTSAEVKKRRIADGGTLVGFGRCFL